MALNQLEESSREVHNSIPDWEAARSLTVPEQISDYVESHRRALLILLTTLYFAGTFSVSSTRPFWYDEIFTAYLARLDSTSHLWGALSDATDVTPPLFNLITRFCVWVFGPTEFAIRLPGAIGFWVLGLSLFAFMRRRASILFATAAFLIPVCTVTGDYAMEARPYGLVLGGCGLILVFWQAAAEGRRRALTVPALAISIAVTTAIHYYAALFLFPIAVGEMVRATHRKKIDWPIVTTFLAAPSVLLLHWKWIRIAMSYSGGDWSAVSFGSFASTYSGLLGSYLPLAFAGITLTVVIALMNRAEGVRSSHQAPIWEVAMTMGTLALPAVAMLAALMTNGIFTSRYSIPTIIGFALAISLVPFRNKQHTAALGLVYFVVSTSAFTGLELWRTRHTVLMREPSKAARFARHLETQGQPIVVNDAHEYLEIAYYASPEMQARLFYVASPDDARRIVHFDDDDRSLLLLRKWAPLNVFEYRQFLRQYSRFALYGRPQEGWLLAKCLEDMVHVQAVRVADENMFMMVNRPTLTASLAEAYD